MLVHFTTFGCKVNHYETEFLKEEFTKNYFTITEKSENADVFVVNSCTVTSGGDKKLFKELRRLKKLRPNAIIVLCGCYPQSFSGDLSSLDELSDVDIITGTKNRSEIPKLVADFISKKNKIVSIEDFSDKDCFESMINTGYDYNTRAFMKIQDGCNMFCSYCIIPYTRGRFRSKSLEDIILEAQGFANAGFKEIVLVGINLSFYGVDFGLRLIDAIEAVSTIDGIERIRLSSLEPEVILDEDIERMKKIPKLCPHFHLSLQSGCDRTLKAMNRRYTSSDYRNLVEKLRGAFENPSFTTDIMVGFPDETDEDFLASAKFAEEIGFAKIHIFPYSRRKGTVADAMENQISTEMKNKRAKIMAEYADRSAKRFLQSQVGRTVKVLFEREKNDGFHIGYTENYTHIKILQNGQKNSLRNSIEYAIIKSTENYSCIAELKTNI